MKIFTVYERLAILYVVMPQSLQFFNLIIIHSDYYRLLWWTKIQHQNIILANPN